MATGLVHSARCVPSKRRIRSGDMIGVVLGVTVGAPRSAFIEDLDFADDLSAALNLEFAELNLARDAPRRARVVRPSGTPAPLSARKPTTL